MALPPRKENVIHRYGATDKYFLSMQYDPDVIEEIKATFRYRFDPALKRWAVFISTASHAQKLLDFAAFNSFKMDRKDKAYLNQLIAAGKKSMEKPDTGSEANGEE